MIIELTNYQVLSGIVNDTTDIQMSYIANRSQWKVTDLSDDCVELNLVVAERLTSSFHPQQIGLKSSDFTVTSADLRLQFCLHDHCLRQSLLCQSQIQTLPTQCVNWLIELWFYVPLDKKQVISETFPLGLAWKKLNLTQQKHVLQHPAWKRSGSILKGKDE